MPRPEATGRRPNIVLVTICSLRHSHLGYAGYSRPTTPHLDRLAEQSVVFAEAVAASSWTKPAVATLLTGLPPNAHRLTDYYGADDVVSGRVTPKRVLADEAVTLAECLRDGGYRTMGRVNNVHAGPFYGLDQGFDDYRSDRDQKLGGMLSDFERWLSPPGGGEDDGNGPPDRPFFLFLMTKDAHSPYRPSIDTFERFDRVDTKLDEARLDAHTHAFWQKMNRAWRAGETVPPAQRRHLVDLYDAALADLDADLGRLPEILDSRGVAEDTIVVVVGDHGERFFEPASRGGVGHGHFLDAATLHVPLLIRAPGELPRRVPGPVRSLDVWTTLVAGAGLEPLADMPGRDLFAPDAATGASAPAAFASFKETEHMVRQGAFSFYRRPDGREELFASVKWERPEREVPVDSLPARRARGALDRWLDLEERLRDELAPAPLKEVPSSVEDELRALGYVE